MNLSLRARAVLGGFVWIMFAVGLSGYVLLSAFDEIARRAFDNKLSARLDQMETLIRSGALDPERAPADGRTGALGPSRPTDFWQIEAPDGRVFRSPNLGEERLPDPDGARNAYFARAPSGLVIKIMARDVAVDAGAARGGAGSWRILAGEALATLSRDQLEFRRSLFGALIGLGASLILAGAAQTGLALRPLATLRAAFWDYRQGEADRIVGNYPADIEPLVEDLNELLERNAQIISRARRQAADLAHALKTPAAILRNEIDAMDPPSPVMRDALDRIESLMARYTARARLAGANAPGASAELAPLAQGLGRVMARVHADKEVALSIEIPRGLRVRAEKEDVEELLGNLLDNAFKWADGRVRVRASPRERVIALTVEDDGPGIPPEQREAALRAGGRLDQSTPGTGLGLAIASDILEAYGGDLVLDRSEDLGGLAVRITLPRAKG
ncbi:sensor histidine kinase [Oceanicella actignis]|uniref:sensor histidine kinase n=1 Tax=Oceanicella actignis TaxID=1189325 RepID=UPI0011E659FD|nr:sensor histidine kinase [Oceanicella actignis]TYO90500.1 signal transduction histidine kinase [Oceanicella actignis]